MIPKSNKYDYIVLSEDGQVLDFYTNIAGSPIHIKLFKNPNLFSQKEVNKQIELNNKRRIVLLIPDSWCLPATFNTNNIPKRHRKQALDYIMEEEVPLPVEEFVADYLSIGPEGQVFGICCEKSRLEKVVGEILECGQCVEYICPISLVELQKVVEKYREPEVYIFRKNKHNNIFLIKENKPYIWMRTTHSSNELPLHLYHLVNKSSNIFKVALYGDACKDRTSLNSLYRVEILEYSDHAKDLTSFMDCIEFRKPWINFNRHSLVTPSYDTKKSINVLFASILILFISLNIVIAYRISQYKSVISDNINKKSDIYTRTFPGDELLSDNLASLLQTEYDRLVAQRGQPKMPISNSPLRTLYIILCNLPINIRFRIDNILLDQNKIKIEGESLTHSTASAIAKSLSKNTNWEMDMPRTQKIKGQGIRFTLESTLNE